MGFEPTISVFVRAKTVHALESEVTVTCQTTSYLIYVKFPRIPRLMSTAGALPSFHAGKLHIV
jgi:hypothetical protein